MVDNIAAINAYKQIANLPKVEDDSSSDNGSGGAFLNMVQQSLDSSFDKVKASEQVGLRALSGEASVEELTIAITQAEGALRTVSTVRDKVISAYQDIIKMPI